MPEEIIWRATEKQRQFLRASEFFVLYGGAAGGGKTDAMIIDALGLNNPGSGKRAIDFPHYTALFLRRSLPQLGEVIRRTHDLYPKIGARENPNTERIDLPVWKEQKKVWVFPSGAQIHFGYVSNELDKYQYQGWEYQWIGWEEITQWPTESAFQYLNSRLRKKSELPVRPGVRATCNPGGVGHQWVRDFWGIPDDGANTNFTVPVPVTLNGEREIKLLSRRFIRSTLEDNPHVDQQQYATMLAGMSPQMRRALREGRWDIVNIEGVIFNSELAHLHAYGHIREVPYNPRYPVNTFWDLGVGDATTIWFHQRIENIDYFIDYYEQSNVGIKEHMRMLNEKPYLYGCHFLPHDVRKRQDRGAEGLQEMLAIFEDLGLKPIHVVPRTNDIRQGIEQARIVLPHCIFDKERCRLGLKRLGAYRYKVDEKTGTFSTKPHHGPESHGADAFRQFAQSIDEIDDVMAEVGEEDRAEVAATPWARDYEPPELDTSWMV